MYKSTCLKLKSKFGGKVSQIFDLASLRSKVFDLQNILADLQAKLVRASARHLVSQISQSKKCAFILDKSNKKLYIDTRDVIISPRVTRNTSSFLLYSEQLCNYLTNLYRPTKSKGWQFSLTFLSAKKKQTQNTHVQSAHDNEGDINGQVFPR